MMSGVLLPLLLLILFFEEEHGFQAPGGTRPRGVTKVAQSPFETAVEATLDTLEDVAMHLRRFRGAQPPPDRAKLVVLGSGWAAHALSKVLDADKFETTIVSPVNHFCFTPMLPSAAVGTVEYRSMTETMRRANPLMEYVQASAVGVDTRGKRVELDDGTRLEYDKLVLAVGVKVNDGIVPGAAEHCFRLKQVEDALELRESLSRAFDEAARRQSKMTVVVVGGGPTGVELTGELIDFIKDIRGRLYPRLAQEPELIMIAAGQQLLQPFKEPQRTYTQELFESEGVQLLLGTLVKRVDQHEIVVATGGEKNTPPRTIPFTVCVWCAGTAPQPIMTKLLDDLPPDHAARAGKGFVAVDAWLRVKGLSPDVYALGDCARASHLSLPQTAQVAAQQGAFLARHLNRQYDDTLDVPALPHSNASLERLWIGKIRNAHVAPRFDFLDLGQLAYVGGGKALTQLKWNDTSLGAYTGGAAFLLWKSVYLVKQVATRNRVLVTFDWIKTALFGRDITRV